MPSSTALGLLCASALLGGVTAGVSAEKVLVELPSWAEAGAMAWAEFTRAHDTGLRFVYFPIIGGSALLCSVAAALWVRLERGVTGLTVLPAFIAALLAISALLVTVIALAPPRLGLNHASDDVLHDLFARVVAAWRIKAALHVLTFGANVWALAAFVGLAGA